MKGVSSVTNIAMEQLIEQYSVYLLKLAFVYVKDKQQAEDIVQEVFVQLYTEQKYEERGKMKSYLSTLVVNRCKNYLKSWSYRMVQLKEALLEKPHQPKDQLIESDERQMIGDAIFALPLKYREVLFLYYYEEMKISEIAASILLSENTVKTRLVKARQLLKDTLPQHDWEVLGHE